MRKIVKILICIISLVVLSGCGKDKYYTCKININNDVQNYSLKGIYKIYYDGNYVTKIEKSEKYISSEIDVLNYFKEAKELYYNNLKDIYGGYEYKIDIKDEDLSLIINIDLSKLNIKDMVYDGYINEYYVVSNKLTTSGVKELYKSKGAICD